MTLMGFPERLLTPGEVIILDLRPHWKALVVPVFWTLVIAVATGFLLAWSGGAEDIRTPLRLTVLAAAIVVWIIVAGIRILRWRFTEFVLTGERLIARSGIIAKRAKEIPLERINDITVTQTVLERVLGAGSIVLESAGEYGQETFKEIGHPVEVQKEIYSAAEKRRVLNGAGPSVADELAKLADLRDRGLLSFEEFETQKRKLLEG